VIRARADRPTPDKASSVVELMDEALAHSPADAVAVQSARSRLTWAQLDRTAAGVAGILLASSAGNFVPVLAARSAALPAAWLGVLRAGSAYVPLALETPVDRLRHVLAETSAPMVIADGSGRRRLAEAGIGVQVIDLDKAAAASWAAHADRVAPEPGKPAVVIYTSGTTGSPKGVLLPHRGLLHGVRWWSRYSGLTADDTVLSTWGTGFDGATFDTFRTLVAGARLIYADDDERLDPAMILQLITGDDRVTVTSMTPCLLQAVLEANDKDQRLPAPPLRSLTTAGEPLSRRLAVRARQQFGVTLHNLYGPTEASCIATAETVDPDEAGAPTIGRPITGTQVYVLGSDGEAVPPGSDGELCIAGPGVALGYLGQPDLTHDTFIADPHANRADALIYRTGDRGLLRPDGRFEILGRTDQQLKIFGHRVEPLEVARLMEQHPRIAAAVVHSAGDPPRLAAHVMTAPGDHEADLPTHESVAMLLRRWLPDAAVPTEIWCVPALPRTPNHKLDLAALGSLPGRPLPHAACSVSELTALQQAAADFMTGTLLGSGMTAEAIGPLGPESDFFALGGRSLLATRLLATVERDCGTQVQLRSFLADPTVAGLARLIGAGDPGDRLKPAGRPDLRPASRIQKRLWILDRIPQVRQAYITPCLFEFHGTVDAPILRDALSTVLGRHPALRARFTMDRNRKELFFHTSGPPPVELVQTEQHDADRLTKFWSARFDLETDAPARGLVLIQNGRCFMAIAVHHIACDGQSMRILLREIAEVYRAKTEHRPIHLPVPPMPRPEEPDVQVDEAYLAGLRGAPTDVELPRTRQRSAVQSVAGEMIGRNLGAELTSGIRRAAKHHGCTTFMIVSAALGSALARRSRQRDFLIAFPWLGRDLARSAEEIGMYVNTLLLRADLTGHPTWSAYLDRIRRSALAAYRGAATPFDDVAAELHPERGLDRPPVTPVFVTVEEDDIPLPELCPGIVARKLRPTKITVKYEVELTAIDEPDDLVLRLSYATAVMDKPAAEALLDDIASALANLVADPGDPVIAEPAADLVERIAKIWSDVLGEPDVPCGSGFFDIGGDSISLILLRDALSDLTGQEISAADLFAHNTVSDQARLLTNMVGRPEARRAEKY
jgi:amino acid adenylation domain-containing protein